METVCKKCGEKLKKTNIIASVKPESTVAMDGIKPGNRIIAIDDFPVNDFDEIVAAVREKPKYKITIGTDSGEKIIDADRSYGLFLNVEFEPELVCSSCGTHQKNPYKPIIIAALAAAVVLIILILLIRPIIKNDSPKLEMPEDPQAAETQKINVGSDDFPMAVKVGEANIDASIPEAAKPGEMQGSAPSEFEDMEDAVYEDSDEDSDSEDTVEQPVVQKEQQKPAETVASPRPASNIADGGIKEEDDSDEDEDYGDVPLPPDLLPVNLGGMAILFPDDSDIPFKYCAAMIKSYADQYFANKITRDIMVEGDACTLESEEHNIDLSRRRAKWDSD